MILDQLAESTQKRVEALKQLKPLEEVKQQALELKNQSPFAFEKALRGDDIAFICEIKKASPSKGVIAADFPYLDIARDYEKAGASAISVLTEPEYFLGNDAYLNGVKETVRLPVIRKDFTIDEYQIYEAALIGADAVLLICALLETETIGEYIHIADTLGLSCLVEAHDEREAESAVKAGARIIGVNNRDLRTFKVNITNSIKLRKLVPNDILFVSESGIKTAADIEQLRQHKVNAVLIGETLMRSSDKTAELKALRGD